ncbi:MAG TPA: cysteine peptidase family C39 domain-containing protein [Planctomycetota bacterium]|nr:cysteine peptidase family C39 domain-containing protein [Planctomycetota bacterium]
MKLFCAAPLFFLCASCVSLYSGSARPTDAAILDGPDWVAVRNVPVLRQESQRDCGAAALAIVLAVYGDRVSPAEIMARCQAGPDRGIRAEALRTFALSRGLAASLISATREDLIAELADGRPLLVGVVKPAATGGFPHYEVIVGIQAKTFEVASIDPARGLTVNTWEGFLREWDPADRLALVAGREGK